MRFYEAQEGAFLTSDFIFAETMSLTTKRLGKRIAVGFGQGIRDSSRFRIEEPSPEVREHAWSVFTSQLDKDYDLIDCISFALMEAFGLEVAFGFDRHFRQHGFRLVPR